jgi:hypothetical protein
LIAQYTSKLDQTTVYDAPLFKMKGGGPDDTNIADEAKNGSFAIGEKYGVTARSLPLFELIAEMT